MAGNLSHESRAWLLSLPGAVSGECSESTQHHVRSCLIIVLRMKAMLLVTLVFSLTILMMASRATAHSYGTTYYGKRMAEDTPSLTKR